MMSLRRSHYFLLALLATFFNPLVILWYGTSQTFILVVPVTLLVWFAVKWDSFVKLSAKSGWAEVILGGTVYLGDLTWNAYSHSAIGLSDMLVLTLALIVGFFGFRSIKQEFLLPTAYLAVLAFSYYAEFHIPQIQALQNFLAQVVVSVLTPLGIKTMVWSSSSDIITVWGRQGIPGPNPFSLWIEKDCTGVKGMLAYGSLAILMVLDVKTTLRRKIVVTVVGLAGTFIVNIGRLLVIFLSAYNWGVDAGLTVHAYLGYGLFIAWVLVYWTLALRYVSGPAAFPLPSKETLLPRTLP